MWTLSRQSVFGRRDLLVSVAALIPAGLAGCAGRRTNHSGGSAGVAQGPIASLRMTNVADADLPSKVLRTVGTDDGSDRQARLLDRILDGGTAIEATEPPFPGNEHLVYDAIVYQLSYDVTERTPAVRYSVRIDIVEGSPDESETIHFAQLPAVDREKLTEYGFEDGDPIGIGTTVLYTNAERDQSVLVPDSEYSVIVWENGERAEWIVDRARDTTLQTYQYTAEQVATAAEYGQQMRERFAFELSGLSDAQRDIVKTAIEDGRYGVGADERPSSAFLAIIDRFREHKRAHRLDADAENDDNQREPYIIEYENDVYWALLIVIDETFSTVSKPLRSRTTSQQ